MKEEEKTVLVANFENIFLVGIDDLSILKGKDTRVHGKIIEMDMTMDHVGRPVFFQQVTKNRKP